RFWEARNVKNGGELMGIDLLFLEEKREREIVRRMESAKIEMCPMAVIALTYSHGNAADIFQMYELFIELTIRASPSPFHNLLQKWNGKWSLHLLITTNKRLVSPVFLHHDSDINLLARKSRRPLLILPTVDHLCGVLFTLYRSPMTIPLTGNSNIKPLNLSQALTIGLLQFLLNLMCTRPMRNASLNPFRYTRT
ncbi:unnamed protein product, partial [Brassica rapa]